MSVEICSCVDARRCCICDVALRGKTQVVVKDDGGEVHLYCITCGQDDDSEDEGTA